MNVIADFPPGSRVRVRDEEWMVEKSLALSDGGIAIHVHGLTDLVRHHKAVFLNQIDDIKVLNPEETHLVADDSPGYRRTRLFIETLLRRTPPTDELLRIGHNGALDVMPYQLFPAHKALSAPRARILIADGTGLGKTVEVGILLSELVKRGRGQRILVVAIKSMLAQLQRELWARFTLPLVRLDSEGILRVQQKIPSNRNPFSYFDRCILSVDTLKNNARYRAFLEEISWDVIVVDECHNVSNKGSQREQLARLLAAKCDTLILTSATPHSGKPESFANLMRMLDPTAIADERHFAEKDVKHLYVRRFKKDVENDAKNSLQDRKIVVHEASASAAEEEAFAALHALNLNNLGKKRIKFKDHLLRWALLKAFLSSPDAALETIDERISNTEKALKPDSEGSHPNEILLNGDLRELRKVREKVTAAANAFSKLTRLIQELRAIKFTGKADSPRVVIFSERISTLDLLQNALAREFGITNPEAVIGRYDASSQLSEKALRDIQESFGRESSPMRLLLASDAASEGVNLHYHCSQLFHFDIPWSLIRLTQRNGRIDRFGQKYTPHLHYLMTCTRTATADQHVMKRLVEKEDTATRQLGDVGGQLGLYDPDAEDRYITESLAKGVEVEAILPDKPLAVGLAESLTAFVDDDENAVIGEVPQVADADAPIDLIALLEGPDLDAPVAPKAEPIAPPDKPAFDLLAMLAEHEKAEAKVPPMHTLVGATPSLYRDDYAFSVAALRHLEKHPVVGEEPLTWEYDDQYQILRVRAPEPFRIYREAFLPAEAVPDNGTYQLVQSRGEVAKRLRKALESDGSWPDWHLLWEQHPLLDWMLDALAVSYARLEAPVLRIGSLGKNEALFLMNVTLYNTESQAVYANWFAVQAQGVDLQGPVLPFDDLVKRVGLVGELVNTGESSNRTKVLEGLVRPAIQRAREFVAEDREKTMKVLRKRAREESRRVEEWYRQSLESITSRRAAYASKPGGLPKLLEKKLTDEKRNVERAKKNHDEWLGRLQAAGAPYVRLVAVFSGD